MPLCQGTSRGRRRFAANAASQSWPGGGAGLEPGYCSEPRGMLQSRNLQGLEGTQAPRGLWWKAWGGQTLPLKAEGMGSLTPRPSPLCPSCESSGELGPEAEPGGSSHRCPWARGWDGLGREPRAAPHPHVRLKAGVGLAKAAPTPLTPAPTPSKIYLYTQSLFP